MLAALVYAVTSGEGIVKVVGEMGSGKTIPGSPRLPLVISRSCRRSTVSSTQSYRDFAFRLDPIVGFIKSPVVDRWTTPHPWVNLFIPASETADFISDLVADLIPADLGVLAPGVIALVLLYPFSTGSTQQGLLPVPDEAAAFHLSLLRFPPAHPAQIDGMLADNRTFYDQVATLGGKRYAIGAISNFTPADWEQHFGPK